MSLDKLLDGRLNQRKADQLFRELKVQAGLIDFCSNDYLGLSRSKQLNELITQQYKDLPTSNGSTGSRLLSGNSDYVEKVEQRLARLFNGESALIFNSGYAANTAVLSALPKKGDTILYDELAHASIKDGARLSLATRFSFRHNDLNDLERKLSKATGKRFIVVESIYSMDGDQSPLTELIALAKKYDSSIILDEAHSTGSLGDLGSGLATSLHIEQDIDVRIYTFGKAMGIHGACAVGSRKLRDYMINFARPFIYTTALPLHALVSINCAFEFLSQHIELQDLLQKKIETYLSASVNVAGKKPSKSAIQTVVIPGNTIVRAVAHELQNSGFDIRPILSPTVQKGKERLRICLHTFNTDSEILDLSARLEYITNTTAKT